MQISKISLYNNRVNNKTSFKGAIGDNIVRKIVTENRQVEANGVLDLMKGHFGFSNAKVSDVISSFISKLIDLNNSNAVLRESLDKANQQIASFPGEIKSAVLDAEIKLRKSFDSVLASKNAELANLRAIADKYSPMAEVKSIEEIGTVMPDEAIDLIKEIAKHDNEAHESLLNYLMKGNGQEKLIEQLDRKAILKKAMNDGITDIPKVKEVLEENSVTACDTVTEINRMIPMVLYSSKDGAYLVSPVIREQVLKNAMALMNPHFSFKYYNTTKEYAENNLRSTLEEVSKFHTDYAAKIAKVKKKYPNCQIIENRCGYNINDSRIEIRNGNDIIVSDRPMSLFPLIESF